MSTQGNQNQVHKNERLITEQDDELLSQQDLDQNFQLFSNVSSKSLVQQVEGKVLTDTKLKSKIIQVQQNIKKTQQDIKAQQVNVEHKKKFHNKLSFNIRGQLGSFHNEQSLRRRSKNKSWMTNNLANQTQDLPARPSVVRKQFSQEKSPNQLKTEPSIISSLFYNSFINVNSLCKSPQQITKGKLQKVIKKNETPGYQKQSYLNSMPQGPQQQNLLNYSNLNQTQIINSLNKSKISYFNQVAHQKQQQFSKKRQLSQNCKNNGLSDDKSVVCSPKFKKCLQLKGMGKTESNITAISNLSKEESYQLRQDNSQKKEVNQSLICQKYLVPNKQNYYCLNSSKICQNSQQLKDKIERKQRQQQISKQENKNLPNNKQQYQKENAKPETSLNKEIKRLINHSKNISINLQYAKRAKQIHNGKADKLKIREQGRNTENNNLLKEKNSNQQINQKKTILQIHNTSVHSKRLQQNIVSKQSTMHINTDFF